MKGTEFSAIVKKNTDGDKILNGTEFNVFDKNNKFLGVVGVQRSIVVFASINPPVDLYTDDYTFIEKKESK